MASPTPRLPNNSSSVPSRSITIYARSLASWASPIAPPPLATPWSTTWFDGSSVLSCHAERQTLPLRCAQGFGSCAQGDTGWQLQLTLMGGAIAVALRGTVWPCWSCLTHQLNLDNPLQDHFCFPFSSLRKTFFPLYANFTAEPVLSSEIILASQKCKWRSIPHVTSHYQNS